jgi:tetratricopeptide (TPR) repeat protein
MKNIIFLLFVCITFAQPAAGRSQVDSLINALNKAADTGKISIYADISNQVRSADPEQALVYAKKMYSLAVSLKDTPGMARADFLMGLSNVDLGNFDLSITYYTEALRFSEIKKNTSYASKVYSSLGVVYSNKGDHPQALTCFLKSLTLKEQTGEKSGLGSVYNNIGNIYFEEENFAMAWKYYSAGIKAAGEVNDSMMLANLYENIVALYSNEKKYTEARQTALRVLAIRERMGSPADLAFSYLNVGSCYAHEHNYTRALEYFNKAYNIYKTTTNKYYLCGVYQVMSEAYLNSGQTGRAYFFLDSTLALAKELKADAIISQCNYDFALYYELKGNYKKALEYYKLFTAKHDSVFSADKNKKIAEMQTRYETEKKENEIALLHKNTQVLTQKNQIQQLQIRHNRYLIAGVGSLALSVTMIFLLIIGRNKLNSNIQKAELEQKLLRSQMDPHFVFNSLVAIQNFVYSYPPEETSKYIASFAKLMRLTLEASRQDKITIEKEVAILEHYLQLQQLRFNNSFDYEIKVDPEIDSTYITIPPFLSQPFVENAIEHGIMNKTDGRGVVSVRFILRGKVVCVEIEDNGIGRENASTLKRKDHISLATSITEERLLILNKKSKQKITMQIKDMVKAPGISMGTKVILNLSFA